MHPWLAIAIAALLLTAGCSRKAGGFKNKAEELQFRIEQLEADNRRLAAERGELEATVSELTRTLDAATGTSSGAIIAAIPRCAGIQFDRLTSFVDRDDRPGFEAVDVYLRPFDGRRRFVPIAGSLRVQLVLHPPATETQATDPNILAEVILDPTALREAYRESFLGTHYAATLTLYPPIPPGAPPQGNLELSAHFEDAVTGLRHMATRAMSP